MTHRPGAANDNIQVGWYSMFHGLEKFMDVKYVCGKLTHTVDTQNKIKFIH